MADSYHHAVSSTRKWGGAVEDYLPIHQWFDCTKAHFADPRHRALRHHSEGIALMVECFGPTLTTNTGRIVPTRWVGEQHVREDFGFIPTVQDFLRHMEVQEWMVRGARPLSRELEVA